MKIYNKKAEGIQIMDLFFLKIYYPLLIQQKSKIKKIWVYFQFYQNKQNNSIYNYYKKKYFYF